MKFQDSSFNGLKVTVCTKSVTHPLTDAPKAICPINFFKVGGIMTCAQSKDKDQPGHLSTLIGAFVVHYQCLCITQGSWLSSC